MFLNSLLRDSKKAATTVVKPITAPLKRELNSMAHLERDCFEALLDRVPGQLSKEESQARKRYIGTLQKTDLRGYQDYRQAKYKEFLKEAGVKRGPLQHELMHDLQASDHVRNNYTYFRQQQNKLAGTPAPQRAQVIASSPALESETKTFKTFKGSLINETKLKPKKLSSLRKAVEALFDTKAPSITPRSTRNNSVGSINGSHSLQDMEPPKPNIPRLPIYETKQARAIHFTPVKATSIIVKPKTSIQQTPNLAKNTASVPSVGLQTIPKKSPPPPPPARRGSLTSNNSVSKSVDNSHTLKKSSSDPNLSAHLPMKFEHLYGTDLKKVTFQQRNSNTCYVLAPLDNLLHHPQGENLLKSIQITKTPRGYLVKFPAQKHAVAVLESDLKQRGVVQSRHIGIPVIEQAYLKLPGVNPNDIGESLNALGHMFKEDQLPNVKPFNWNLGPLSHNEYKTRLLQLVHEAKANPQQMPIVTALRSMSEHISSIRLLESTPTHIKRLDPIYGIKTEPIDEFIEEFKLIGFGKGKTEAIEGLRSALNDDLVNTMKGQRNNYKGQPENLKNLREILLNDTDLLYRAYKQDAKLVNLALDVK